MLSESIVSFIFPRLTASDIMEPNLTYVYPHTRVQSLVSILRTTVYHAFPVVTENRQNERDFMKGNILVSNNIRFKVCPVPFIIFSRGKLSLISRGSWVKRGGVERPPLPKDISADRNDLVDWKHL